MHDYWLKQSADQPLFPDLVWSRPENRSMAGKLLIVGGNIHGFSALGEAFMAAEAAGIGEQVLLMPDKLSRTVGPTMTQAIFAPSTPSGSLSRQALSTLLDNAAAVDGCLLAGDFGKNSETEILLDSFIAKYSGPLTLTQDSIDYFLKAGDILLGRPQTLIVVSLAQLQKLVQSSKLPIAVTSDTGLVQFVDKLHDITTKFPAGVMTTHQGNVVVASGGQVSTTKQGNKLGGSWQIACAATAATWWAQNPNKQFEAATSSLNSS